jgi:hypothetical protein
MAQNTSAKQLFDLLVSRNFDPELLDSAGKPAANPAETEVFSFDFTTQSGNDYGTVVIMLGDDNNLEVYFGDNVGKSMEGPDKKEWFAFLEQLKHFSTRNLMSFGLKNLNRLRYSMQGQAAIKEGLFESWRGTRTVSYNDKPEAVRLMIRHKKPIGEGDARYRYVESLYVETTDGERFKLPFTKLAGGRAMVEHVRNGGKPYDLRGQHIAAVVEELNVLSRFRRANAGQVFEGNTAELISETNAYYENLNKMLKGLGTHRGYTNYFESWNPAEITEQDVVIESIKNLFVRETIDTRIEQALPVLARIQKQGQAMKEANIFEAWANRLVEGTWSTPDTPEKQAQLVELLSKEFPVGADATNATEQLYDLIGDDMLFDQLETLADQNADADARQIVYDRLVELSDDPSIAEVLNQLNIDTDTPAEIEDPADELSEDEMTPDEIRARAEKNIPQVIKGMIRDYKTMNDNEFKQTHGMTRQQFNQTLSPTARDYYMKEDENEASPVESAILRRIMNSHLELLKQYGPAAVMAAARDVAEMIGDVEEIGSSDVSAYVKRVVQSLNDGSYADLAEGQGGNVMWKELDRVTRLERLRDLAKRMGDKEKFAKLDAEIKDIYSKPTTEEEQLNEFLPALGAAVGRAVAANAIGSMLNNDDEVDEGIPGNLPPGQIPGKDKLLKTPTTKPQGVADKVKDVLGGIKDFVSGKPEDPSRPTYEADNLSTFEGKCNMTAEGEECPMHGLKECGYMEGLDTDGVMSTKPSNMSSESVDPMLARMKSLAGILAK